MKPAPSWWAVVALALLLSACSGADDAASVGVAESRHRPLQAEAVDEVDALFDWAQRQYPDLFPGPVPTQDLPPWRYRHYPGTGNYVGVADGRVAILGTLTGGSIVDMGPLARYRCQVRIDACTRTAVARIQNQGDADFGLTDDGRLVYAVRGLMPFGALPKPEAAPVAASTMLQVASGVRQFQVLAPAVSAGGGMYLDQQGSVYAWGPDHSGWISGTFGSFEFIAKPRKLPWPGPVQEIGFAGNTAIALLTDGTVWKLPGTGPSLLSGDYSVKPARIPGASGVRLLGRGGPTLHVVGEGGVALAADAGLTRFTPVQNTRDIVALSCGGLCLGIQSDGRVIAWGGVGPLGDGSERGSAAAVATMLPATVAQVTASDHSASALTVSGELWVWGGQGFQRGARPRLEPARVEAAGAVIDIDCTSGCILRRSDGSVWQYSVTGLNADGSPVPFPPLVAVPALRLF